MDTAIGTGTRMSRRWRELLPEGELVTVNTALDKLMRKSGQATRRITSYVPFYGEDMK
jgi:hypothetical protein